MEMIVAAEEVGEMRRNNAKLDELLEGIELSEGKDMYARLVVELAEAQFSNPDNFAATVDDLHNAICLGA